MNFLQLNIDRKLFIMVVSYADREDQMQRLNLPRSLLEDLVAVYAKDNILRTHRMNTDSVEFGKTVGERVIDIVISAQGEKFFVDVESERPNQEYVGEYYAFCERTLPFEAWLIAPEIHPSRRNLPVRSSGIRLIMPCLRTVPMEEVIYGIADSYTISIGINQNQPFLALTPQPTAPPVGGPLRASG